MARELLKFETLHAYTLSSAVPDPKLLTILGFGFGFGVYLPKLGLGRPKAFEGFGLQVLGFGGVILNRRF